MEYEKVMITIWNYDRNFKLYCYTIDGISYIVNKYKYNFFKTTKKSFILNKLEINYLIDYYENKYRILNIHLKCIKNKKIYIFRTINEIHKIKLFFDITEIDQPPPYKRSSLIPYNYLDMDITFLKLNITF